VSAPAGGWGAGQDAGEAAEAAAVESVVGGGGALGDGAGGGGEGAGCGRVGRRLAVHQLCPGETVEELMCIVVGKESRASAGVFKCLVGDATVCALGSRFLSALGSRVRNGLWFRVWGSGLAFLVFYGRSASVGFRVSGFGFRVEVRV